MVLPSACKPVECLASLKIRIIRRVFTILAIFRSRKYWAVRLTSPNHILGSAELVLKASIKIAWKDKD